MQFEEFSVSELEKQLEDIKLIEDKIEFIADQMLRCKKIVQELQYEMKTIIPLDIKFNIKQHSSDVSLIEILNRDTEIKEAVSKKIVKTCREKLCERNNHFLERTELLMDHYQTKLDVKVKCKGLNMNGSGDDKLNYSSDRIVWMCEKDKLLNMFSALKEKNILSEYTVEEMLAHFSNEKQVPFTKGINHQGKFRWRKSDNSFSFFVDELAKRNCIDEEKKYLIFKKHFMNKDGNPFKDLAQKKYNTKNFTRTGNLIEKILNSLNFLIAVVCYTSFSLNEPLFKEVANHLAPFI